MTESKIKNLIVAITVGATLLIVILASVMIYQITAITTRKNDIARLEREIARYEQMIKDGEDELEARKTRFWIEREAMRIGYRYQGSEPLD